MRLSTARRSYSATAAAIAAGAVAITTLAACGNSGSSDSSGSTSAASAAYATAQVRKYEAGVPISDVQKITHMPNLRGKTVWYIPFGAAVVSLAALGTNMGSALSYLDAKTHVCDGNFLPTTIVSCLNQAVSQGAAAVVTGYIDYSLAPTAYQNVVAHHIPVLVAGEPPSDGRTSNSALAFFGTSEQTNAVGTIDVDAAIADSEGKGNILYANLTDSSATEAITQAAAAEAKAHCPGCTFQTVNMSASKLNLLPSAISAKLVSDPKIDYILNSDDTYLPEIISGITSAGATNRVKVLSSSGSLAGLQRIAAGQFQTDDVGVNLVASGWAFANALLQLMSGNPVTSANQGGMKLFSTNNVKGLKLTPAEFLTSNWYGGASWKQKYLTAWGVK